ncbi:DUF418 domain-containing protein [Salinadaptatus halalkaliphilus]|uniref:DUF418 domain-containing protein n=1 Tax=Salinadaptatus halalkaliphilus TaxID=2419781 RepID=A0A4S3TMB7_9EURY|nr:DUF418 domain-containing protein [Salinadaptatus halalkaliphilus]THE65342.1 DUF418 domain-containing protein [Salinadaptatus halalkaliphilus]
MSSETSPTIPSDRIVALDALRGVALLGILLVNIWVFSMPEATLSNPTVYGDLSGYNYWAWLGTHVFAQQKFITLFTILFGAGVVLFTRSAERKAQSPIGLFHRRSRWLILFGLAHAYLLWYGDILFAYGVCALGVVFLRDLEPQPLALFGVTLVAVPSILEVLAGLTADPTALASAWRPSAVALEAELEAYRSGWIAQLNHRAPAAFQRQTSGFVSYTAWRVSGSMLLGMALFKWGVLTNDRSSRFYRQLVVGGATSGLTVILAGVWFIQATNWDPAAGLFWRQFNYWGSFALAGAYIGVVMLYCQWRSDGVVTRATAAVGRTAFSNYILQTLLATSIFYGHGLGLFGQVTRLEALGIVVAIWAVQVPLSVLWLRYFQYGPLEWGWRVLTYRSSQQLRRSNHTKN